MGRFPRISTRFPSIPQAFGIPTLNVPAVTVTTAGSTQSRNIQIFRTAQEEIMTDIDTVAEAIYRARPRRIEWEDLSESGWKVEYLRMAWAAIDALQLTQEWGLRYDIHPSDVVIGRSHNEDGSVTNVMKLSDEAHARRAANSLAPIGGFNKHVVSRSVSTWATNREEA